MTKLKQALRANLWPAHPLKFSDVFFVLVLTVTSLIFLSGIKVSLFPNALVILTIISLICTIIHLPNKYQSAILSFLPAVAFPKIAVLIACFFPFFMGLLLYSSARFGIARQNELRTGLALSLGFDSKWRWQFCRPSLAFKFGIPRANKKNNL